MADRASPTPAKRLDQPNTSTPLWPVAGRTRLGRHEIQWSHAVAAHRPSHYDNVAGLGNRLHHSLHGCQTTSSSPSSPTASQIAFPPEARTCSRQSNPLPESLAACSFAESFPQQLRHSELACRYHHLPIPGQCFPGNVSRSLVSSSPSRSTTLDLAVEQPAPPATPIHTPPPIARPSSCPSILASFVESGTAPPDLVTNAHSIQAKMANGHLHSTTSIL